MTSNRDLGQSSFQALVDLEERRFGRSSEPNLSRGSPALAVEKSAHQNWLFEATQRRADQRLNPKVADEAETNSRLVRHFEIAPELSPESKLDLLQDELDRLGELSVDRLRSMRRDVAKLLHPDKIENSATLDTTSKLAEINAALDAAISRTLPNRD